MANKKTFKIISFFSCIYKIKYYICVYKLIKTLKKNIMKAAEKITITKEHYNEMVKIAKSSKILLDKSNGITSTMIDYELVKEQLKEQLIKTFGIK